MPRMRTQLHFVSAIISHKVHWICEASELHLQIFTNQLYTYLKYGHNQLDSGA